QMANAIVPSQLVMISSKGVAKNNFPLNLPRSAPFNNSNKVIYQKTNNSTISLMVYDFTNLRETPLISGPYNPNSDSVYFDNLCLDNKDNFFYWSNHAGIFRCSLSSLHVDTVFKNCENVKYLSPLFQKSRPNELLMCAHFIKPLLPFALLHEYKAVEYDFVTSEKNILDIFP
ncbi:MAG: hypothetical protein IT236_08790, partial [Bacteroidia bacterium]|nr:hypothetical protein [Bacteroidia bacterium]